MLHRLVRDKLLGNDVADEYIRKVEKMAEKDLISEGKREELLLEAYRADIVYNFDEEEANLND